MSMDEFITEEAIQNTEPPSPETPRKRSTGPKTPHGKARSSVNRLTHGCRSEKTALPDEDLRHHSYPQTAWEILLYHRYRAPNWKSRRLHILGAWKSCLQPPLEAKVQQSSII